MHAQRRGRAADYPLVIEQGATFLLALTYSDAAGPVNLTGCSARMQVRSVADNALLLTLTTENGRIALGGAAGTINLSVDAATTSALPLIGARYDFELIFPGGTVLRLLRGAVQICGEVTT